MKRDPNKDPLGPSAGGFRTVYSTKTNWSQERLSYAFYTVVREEQTHHSVCGEVNPTLALLSITTQGGFIRAAHSKSDHFTVANR